MHISKENHVYQKLHHIAHFSLRELNLLLRGILPVNQNFQGGVRLMLFKIGLFSSGEETNESLEENHLCYNHGHLPHCFPENSVNF
jgi:hypothetical protein